MKNTVTQAHVEAQIADIQVSTIFDKVTVVAVRLVNGFVLVESAGAVDKANYSEATGREICLARIKNKIWELEGYQLSTRLAAPTSAACVKCGAPLQHVPPSETGLRCLQCAQD